MIANEQAEIITPLHDAVIVRIVEAPVGGAEDSQGIESFLDYALEPVVVGYVPWRHFASSPNWQ